MIGILLICVAFISLIFILTNCNLKMKVISILLFGFIPICGYYWFLYGLRLKENSKVYFIENRYGEYEHYSKQDLKKALAIALKKDNENKLKMDIAGSLFIFCVVGLILGAVIVLKRRSKSLTI